MTFEGLGAAPLIEGNGFVPATAAGETMLRADRCPYEGNMFWILLLAAQASSGEIVAYHSLGPDRINVELDSACGGHVIRIAFRNEWARGTRGQVTSVSIDNEDVRGAASTLQARASNRSIDRIGIMNCGFDERDPIVMGIMELSPLESRRDGLPPRVFFRVRREHNAWRLSLD